MRASFPAQPIAVAKPAALALAWKTMSASRGAAAGRAKRSPSASATARRDGSTSTSVTSAPGRRAASQPVSRPMTPPPTITILSAGPEPASQWALSAVSILAASTARRGGTVSGTGTRQARGATKRC